MSKIAEHKPKIIVFGAGATGRGHVGLLAWQAGFETVFVDRRPDLVATLLRRRSHVNRSTKPTGVRAPPGAAGVAAARALRGTFVSQDPSVCARHGLHVTSPEGGRRCLQVWTPSRSVRSMSR